MNTAMPVNRTARRTKRLLFALIITLGIFVAFEILKQVAVLETNRIPVPYTFDSVTNTQEFDVKRTIKLKISDPPREFVYWTTRVTGSPSLPGVEE